MQLDISVEEAHLLGRLLATARGAFGETKALALEVVPLNVRLLQVRVEDGNARLAVGASDRMRTAPAQKDTHSQ